MLSRKKQINLKASNGAAESSARFPSQPPTSSSSGQHLQSQITQSSKRGSNNFLNKLNLGNSGGPGASAAVIKLEKGINNGKSAVAILTTTTHCLEEMITNIGNVIATENETQRQRELKQLITSLNDWNSIDDHTLIKLIKELKKNVDMIDEKLNPLIQEILTGNWHSRSGKIVTQVESLISEILVLRPGYAGVVMYSLIFKFSLAPRANSTHQGDEISMLDEKIFAICHRNLKRIFVSFPMKQESGVKTMNSLYPYMGKSPHTHFCYVTNLLKAINYLPDVKGQLLHVIIHKLVRIDVNIPKQDIEALCENQSSRSYPLKKEDGGHEMFSMDLEDDTFRMNPLIETLDLCLNSVFQYVDYVFKPSDLADEEMCEREQHNLFNSLLQIFQIEILPAFGVNNVQFIYFYLLSLQPSFLTNFLEFLWKKVTNINVAAVIRIQTMSYLSGMLARAQFISIRTVKRWLTKMSEWATGYAGQKSKDSHWSSVNVQAHGPFYAVCQTIFYVFAFRNKELIMSRKSAAYTRTLDLGRLVTSELNPLKACEQQIAIFFVDAAHQHQISYCRTVLERNQGATIPTIARQMVSNLSSESELFASNNLESFFPFDPILLSRSKKWTDGVYRTYEPYYEDLKVEKQRERRGETEDSIEMELGSYNDRTSRSTTDYYCNGVIPFKFKSEMKSDLEGFID